MPVIHATGGFKGEIFIDGSPVKIASPHAAMRLGIGMVHQEFMLIDSFEVAENIKLNREETRANPVSMIFGESFRTLDLKRMRYQSRETLARLNLDLNETARVGNLAVGYKQFVEIARELDKSNIRLVVLDEPTAVLAETEAEHFLNCVREVARRGIAFILVSHRLEEIKKYADRIVILRDGEAVGDFANTELSTLKMSELMVGREVEINNRISEEAISEAPGAVELRNFSVNMSSERSRNISLVIKKGEIFGFAGLAGHGKISIAGGIMGLYPATGEILINNQKLDYHNTLQTLRKKIVFVSEDRRGMGLMLEESIEKNIISASIQVKGEYLYHCGFFSLFNRKAALKRVKECIREFDIRCTSPRQQVRQLSGGNQQKVCLARALIMDPEILLVSEPTRGIDIGAKKAILDFLVRLNKELGMTIVVTSSELAEIRSICSRIAIITEGQVAGILRPDDEDYKFGALMSGVKLDETENKAV
jgi:simple sugar transport system ATP-binding protein